MTAQATEATQKLLATLWERNLPVLRERLEELTQAAADANAGALSAEAQASARNTAHKLAGSLGMFGYTQATEIAHELETMLEVEQPDPGRLRDLALELRQEVSL